VSLGAPSSTKPIGGHRPTGVLFASVLTTVSSVYPAFLAGALGVELRDSIGMTERFFGLVIGGFFFGSAMGSIALGRLGERLGARRMITVSLLTTAVVTACIAAFVRSGPVLVGVLVIAGLANSSGQTAANKLLSQSIDPKRLGFAMAVKQSGMPGASLLGGLAVPLIALTVGWQWAYAFASVLALVSLRVVLQFAPDDGPTAGGARPAPPTPVSTHSTLVLAAVAAGFSSAAAGTLGNWATSSAVDAGWSSGAAGLLLSLGAVSGISSRLALGWQADRSNWLPMRTAATFLALGSLGTLLLAPRVQWTHALAVVIAFGAGWGWPALFNFAVVGTNPQAASAATGVTQTGVYVGVFTGPIVFGLMVENFSYAAGWTLITFSMLIGATIMWRLAPRFTPSPRRPSVDKVDR
jgi:MFS family permease